MRGLTLHGACRPAPPAKPAGSPPLLRWVPPRCAAGPDGLRTGGLRGTQRGGASPLPRAFARVLHPLGLGITCAALLLSASACWVPLEQGDIMNSRLDSLEAAKVDQQQRLDDLQKRIEAQEATVKDRVAAIDKKIGELNQASRRSGADLGVSVTRLQDDLAKARGDLEVEQHKLGELEQKLGELQQNVDTRFAALRGRGALDEADAKQLIDGLSNKDDKAAFLALGQQQEQKSPGVARAIYDEYVRRFPGDPLRAGGGHPLGRPGRATEPVEGVLRRVRLGLQERAPVRRGAGRDARDGHCHVPARRAQG